MKSNPNDFDDPQLERDMQAFCESELLASERTLASTGDCPDPREILALSRGEIRAAWRKEAVAKHLLFCTACSDRNLSLLLQEESSEDDLPAEQSRPIGASAPARLDPAPAARPAVIPWPRWVAAAAILIVTSLGIAGFDGGPANTGFSHVRVTDGYGLETRSVHRLQAGEARKVSIAATTAGVVALGRASATGFAWEPVDRGQLTANIADGEELVLPIDHAVELQTGEDWLLVEFAERVASDHVIDQALLGRLLRGEVPDGVTLSRVRFRLDP